MSTIGESRLRAALEKLAERGFEGLDKAEAGERELDAAVNHVRAFVDASTSDQDLKRDLNEGLDVVKAGSPVLASAARSELRELFSASFLAKDAGYVEGLAEMAFQERRAAMRAVTADAAKRARERAERLAFMGDLLEDLGVIALKLLPLLVAAL